MVQSAAWKKVDTVHLEGKTTKGPGIIPIVWDLKLCPFEPHTDVFAVVVGSDVHLMRVGLENGFERLNSCHLQPQQPGDAVEPEKLYCCEWMLLPDRSCPSSEQLCLVIGGHSGIIYVLTAEELELERVIQGHGNSIYGLQTNRSRPNMLLSASADESVRLWNVVTGLMVGVFSGDHGHSCEVLKVSWSTYHPDLFASCGVDSSIRIWSMHQATKKHASKSTCQEDVVHVQIPLFVNSDIHTQYVDDVAWVGELILSKSTCNELVLWRPKGNVYDAVKYNMEVTAVDGVTILRRFKYPGADLWFLHFGLNLSEGLVAVGNKNGSCFTWNLELEDVFKEGFRWGSYKVMDCSGSTPMAVRCVVVLSRTTLIAGLDDGRVVLMQKGG